MKTILKKKWDKLFRQLTPDIHNSSSWDFSEVTFEILFNNYFYGSNRHYHDAQHIRFCLETLDDMVAYFTKTQSFPEELVNFGAIEIAIWFHDFIYDTRENNNEKLSSLAAKQFVLGLTGLLPLAEKVESLILFTKHNRRPVTVEEEILSDIDLSILGDYSSTYNDYRDDIRKEYSWAPDFVYYAGRLKILTDIINGPQMYYTKYFTEDKDECENELSYEKVARKNISKEIESIKEKLNRINENL
jgi:predicted metal-dependent HD superfamily phosphohydrolase